jgi:hypothetical protein
MTDTHNLRNAPKGEVTVKDDRMQVVFRRRYAKPVAKVWAALTTPERLEDWFGAANIDLRVGGTLYLTFANGKSAAFTITRVEAPHVLGWSWMIDGLKHVGLVRACAGRRRLPTHADPWRPQRARPGRRGARRVARPFGRAGGFARRADDALGRQGTARDGRCAALSAAANLTAG